MLLGVVRECCTLQQSSPERCFLLIAVCEWDHWVCSVEQTCWQPSHFFFVLLFADLARSMGYVGYCSMGSLCEVPSYLWTWGQHLNGNKMLWKWVADLEKCEIFAMHFEHFQWLFAPVFTMRESCWISIWCLYSPCYFSGLSSNTRPSWDSVSKRVCWSASLDPTWIWNRGSIWVVINEDPSLHC